MFPYKLLNVYESVSKVLKLNVANFKETFIYVTYLSSGS
jgi:hypothetical protein